MKPAWHDELDACLRSAPRRRRRRRPRAMAKALWSMASALRPGAARTLEARRVRPVGDDERDLGRIVRRARRLRPAPSCWSRGPEIRMATRFFMRRSQCATPRGGDRVRRLLLTLPTGGGIVAHGELRACLAPLPLAGDFTPRPGSISPMTNGLPRRRPPAPASTASGLRPCAATTHQADAAVEGAQHLRVVEIAGALQPAEHGRRLPRRQVDVRGEAVRQHARQVLRQPAAGDVRQRLDGTASRAMRAQHRLHVDARRHQQRFGQRCAVGRTARARPRRASPRRPAGAPASSRWNARPRTAGRSARRRPRCRRAAGSAPRSTAPTAKPARS